MLEVKFYKDGEEYRPKPIEVATMLIHAKDKRETWKNFMLFGTFRAVENASEEEKEEVEVNMFLPFELDEIARHIQVYTEKYRCPIEINGNTENNNVKLRGVKDE